jgi:hypothetical protein
VGLSNNIGSVDHEAIFFFMFFVLELVSMVCEMNVQLSSTLTSFDFS